MLALTLRDEHILRLSDNDIQVLSLTGDAKQAKFHSNLYTGGSPGSQNTATGGVRLRACPAQFKGDNQAKVRASSKVNHLLRMDTRVPQFPSREVWAKYVLINASCWLRPHTFGLGACVYVGVILHAALHTPRLKANCIVPEYVIHYTLCVDHIKNGNMTFTH